jgi:hypothetical protein
MSDWQIVRTSAKRLALGGVTALLGTGIAVAVWLAGRHYVARIEFDPTRRQFHLHTVGFTGTAEHAIDPSDVRGTRFHPADWETRTAPVWTVSLSGWRLPVILDSKGAVLNEEVMATFLGLDEEDGKEGLRKGDWSADRATA